MTRLDGMKSSKIVEDESELLKSETLDEEI